MLNRIHVLTFILLVSFSCLHQEKSPSPRTLETNDTTKVFDRVALIDFAKQYLGTPYRSASIDPKKGFDCSGFVYFVFRKFHIDVPRSSGEYKTFGREKKPEEFRVGDILVFYGHRDRGHYGHVGIIIEAKGLKSRFIHASSGKAYSVTISDLDSQAYRNRFIKCIDVIGQ